MGRVEKRSALQLSLAQYKDRSAFTKVRLAVSLISVSVSSDNDNNNIAEMMQMTMMMKMMTTTMMMMTMMMMTTMMIMMMMGNKRNHIEALLRCFYE